MIDSKDILTLFSIPCEEVSDVNIISDTPEITFVDIELQDNRSNCPFCFNKDIVIKDYYKVKIKNSIIRKHKLYVEIRIRRYRCKCCNKTFKEIINSYSKNTFGVVLTNAMTESNNNYIQTLINIGYGYSNFKRLRKRLLYMSSYKKRD